MKNLLFYCIVAFTALLMFHSCADDLNTDQEYKGPRNTSELETLLKESTLPVLKNLDLDTKESLIEFTTFEDNRLRGFENIDDNIKNLKNTNILEVLTAILQRTIVEKNVTVDLKEPPTDTWSYCANCWWQRDENNCCRVGGEGCVDY